MHTNPSAWIRRLLASLKWRLAAAGVAALALGIGLTSAVLVRKAETETVRAQEQLDHSEAVRTARLLRLRVTAHQQALAAAATQLLPRLIDNEAALLDYLRTKPVLLAEFTSVFIVGADGRMRLIHDESGFRQSSLDLSDSEYFQRAMAQGQPVVSRLFWPQLQAEPAIALVQPVQRDGRSFGLLVGSLRLKSRGLLTGVADMMEGDEGVLVVVADAQGSVLAHPDARMIGASLVAEPRLAGAYEHWRRGNLQNEGPHVPPPGVEKRLVAAAPVPGTDWMVWRSRLRADVLAPLENGRTEALRWAAAIVAVLGLCLVVLLQTALRPLAKLQARAQHLFDDAQDPQAGWPGAAGEIGQVERVLRHVSAERAQLEAFNHQVLRQLESVMAAAPVGIAFVRGQRFELVSREFSLVVGRQEGMLLGQSPQVIYASEDDFLALGPLVVATFKAGKPYDGEWQLRRADGSVLWGRLRGQPVDWQDPAAGTIWTVHDATEEVASRQALEWSATHDALTGLANRKAFEHKLAQLFSTLPQARPAALVLFDLDRFKPINDGYGHAAGDAMLRAVAAAAQKGVRASDLLVRLGGDEFAVVLEHCPVDVAVRVAEELRKAITVIRVPWEGHTLDVGASFGVAALTEPMSNAAAWIEAADEACYAAKAAGRGQVMQAGVPGLRLVATR